MMKICLLTYDAPHLKTAQVALGLHNRGIERIDLLLMPFSRRPERTVTFQHRPFQFCGPTPQSLASLWGGSLHRYDEWRTVIGSYDHVIVCGSNLIEPEFANCGKVLNVHAGLIPSSRGLDSFKWAILEGKPLGNTLHVINEDTDAGEVLGHVETPVFIEDDIQTLANRHYENEIWMLVNFDLLIKRRAVVELPIADPKKRMPLDVEEEMLRSFDSYKLGAVNRQKTLAQAEQ